jgi:hypothetical protein
VIKKTTLLLGAVASVFLSLPAQAALQGSAGSTCVAATTWDAPFLDYLTVGVSNGDAAAAHSAVCGLVRLSSSSPRTLFVSYWDGTDQGRVSCFVSVSTFTGSPLWSQTQSSDIAGIAGGTFQFSLPSSAVGYVVLSCSLPPMRNNNLSGIGAHYLQ